MDATIRKWTRAALAAAAVVLLLAAQARSGDLEDIRKAGELRHLGIPYANFVTGHGDGLDVEIVRRFAEHLGVAYRYVPSTWSDIFGDLTGRRVRARGDDVELLEKTPVRGDMIANGLTVLAWRQKVVDYSTPTFPTQVWCIARAEFPAHPVVSSGDIDRDIRAVKLVLAGRRVMGKDGTCLAPGLYGIDENVARVFSFPGGVNDIAPAVIKGEADVALLDVPDSLVALEKWPGMIKILGPLSEEQRMAAAFRKTSPELRAAFDAFFAGLVRSGEYRRMVERYYPAVFRYFPEFFGNPG
ncbi:MAG: transporter substrate-binding domain-containing protein [Desulfovibrionaceae bacterium]|jgi:ABC-type amino acid transport substrate-binding protein|nr:transporter substrate-binding domain-containing protein [Desulfovibrionaceae bacterium]